MTLELEEEKFEQIKIFSNSDPDQLAYTFCKEHNLDFSAMEYLKEKIDNLIQKYKNKNDDSQIEEVESEINISESNNSTVKNSKIILNKKIEFPGTGPRGGRLSGRHLADQWAALGRRRFSLVPVHPSG